MLYCYFDHHKCASTWISGIVFDVCSQLGLRPCEGQLCLMENPAGELTAKNAEFFICRTSEYSRVNEIPKYRGFHVIRDPRDIIVSGYYSHLFTHPLNGWNELRSHRENLKKLNKKEGLLSEMEFSEDLINHIRAWNYNDPNIKELKMSVLIKNPVEEFIDIFKFLGLFNESDSGSNLFDQKAILNKVFRKMRAGIRFNSKGLHGIIVKNLLAKHRFENYAGGRKPGEEDITSHFRKGMPGDWKNHFDDTHKKKFKDKFSDLVVQLGYEKNNDW